MEKERQGNMPGEEGRERHGCARKRGRGRGRGEGRGKEKERETHTLSYLIHIRALREKNDYYPHFGDKEAGA